MTTPVIMDAIVVIILMVAVIYGAKRGLLQSLAGLVIVALALAGAGIAAGTFTEPVAEFVTPIVEAKAAEKIEATIEEQLGEVEWSLFEENGADTNQVGMNAFSQQAAQADDNSAAPAQVLPVQSFYLLPAAPYHTGSSDLFLLWC